MSKPEENVPTPADVSKPDVETSESILKPTETTRGKDKAAELLASNERIIVSSEENRRVLKKIDFVILPILLSVYFLQSLDKTTLSYASVFGLIEDANLDPNSQQYSWLGSIVYIAQLVMQPIVAVLLVKLRMGKFMGIMVFTWGCILCGMAGAKNFAGLMATRFLLGAFESAVGERTSAFINEPQLTTTSSTGLHRRSPDVVQTRRTDESKRSMVCNAGHREHPRQPVIVRTWPHPFEPPSQLPDHLPLLWTSHSRGVCLCVYLYARLADGGQISQRA